MGWFLSRLDYQNPTEEKYQILYDVDTFELLSWINSTLRRRDCAGISA